jgi:phospholipid/cholesterol/gamma-HCH transport system substrate-binding protein
MNDPAKNILIGLFVVAATAIVIFVMLFLHPVVGDNRGVLRVRFADIDKVSVGTRVTYGGRPVGEVVEIKEMDMPSDPRKPARDGHVYLYELVLRVDSNVKVYNTDEIYARTSGLLGEKSVEINPSAARPGEKVWLVNEDILFADETGSVEETLKEFKELADKVEATLDSFKFAIDELNRSKIWENLGATVKNLNDITTELNIPGKWGDTLNHLEAASKKADLMMSEAAEVSHNVAQGKGTLGTLLVKDDFYQQMRALLNKGSLILDDMGSYGILYQNDKRWQRLKAQRENLVKKLQVPSEFQSYFYNHINEILQSLDKISMNFCQTEPYYQSYVDDEEFKKVFTELMRRVSQMDTSIKLYNQQISDRQNTPQECTR